MTTERLQLFDTLVLDAPRRTNDGYLAASARVARTGIQVYRGYEVGRPDLETVRVFRPEAEVFHKDSLQTYAHRPLTNDHPPVLVTSDNWKKYSVGQTGDEVARDGDYVRVPMVLMDKIVIDDYAAGKRQLSLGYTTNLKWDPGEFNGEKYDAIQTEIRANHLAVVRDARGGPELKLGDADNTGANMTTKTIMVDGLPVEVTDKDSAIIAKALSAKDAEIADLRAKLTKVTDEFGKSKEEMEKEAAAKKKETEAKDAEIVTLKKLLKDAEMTPARLDSLVKDRAVVVEKAKVILGDELVVENKTDSDIRRQVVDSVLGADAKGWSDEQVASSFSTLTAKSAVGDQFADAVSRGVTTTMSLDKAYEERDKALQDAWKTPRAA